MVLVSVEKDGKKNIELQRKFLALPHGKSRFQSRTLIKGGTFLKGLSIVPSWEVGEQVSALHQRVNKGEPQVL